MSTWARAAGYNNAAGLTTLSMEPACPGILYPRRIYALSGKEYNDGWGYTYWTYDELLKAQYSALLTELGLTTAAYSESTVRILSDAARSTWTTYNAIICAPENPQYVDGRWTGVVFKVKKLVAL